MGALHGRMTNIPRETLHGISRGLLFSHSETTIDTGHDETHGKMSPQIREAFCKGFTLY